jgi:hypothetical protein
MRAIILKDLKHEVVQRADMFTCMTKLSRCLGSQSVHCKTPNPRYRTGVNPVWQFIQN